MSFDARMDIIYEILVFFYNHYFDKSSQMKSPKTGVRIFHGKAFTEIVLCKSTTRF